MTNFAICRISKLSTWGNIAGSGAHTYRHKGMAPNADPRRLGKNQTLVGRPDDVVEDVRRRVDELGQPRKNAVLCVEHLLTASPGFFKGKTPAEVRAWADKNVEFLVERYGRENVAHVTLHLDEETPHLVAYVVPEVGGKLNARQLFGGRDKLRRLQSDYADRFKADGLDRGVEGSKAKHRTVKNFYAALEETQDRALAKLEQLATPIPPPEASVLSVLSKERRA
ncbi:MobV family relaxase, partial [Rhizobium leguminosarum]|uniref:MobV family relaxase n=1 Tax=Rhizobium leguminosarum TaxID=384 RepID=UPI0010E3073E